MSAKSFVSLILAGALAGGYNVAAKPQPSDQPDLQGSVVDEQGRGVPFASLKLERRDFNQQVFCDQDGRFQFVDVPLGQYRVEAEASGFHAASQKLDTTMGDGRGQLILTLARKDEGETAPPGRSVVTVKTLEAPAAARKEYDKGVDLFSRGKYESAIKRFDAALRKHRDFSAARASRGQALLHLGQVEAAYEEFGEALRLEPEAVEANLGMGMACNDLGRYSESEQYLLKAMAAQPGLPATELELGRSYYGQRRYAEAEQKLKKAASAGAKEPSLYLLLANVAMKQRKQGEAIAAMSDYLRVSPEGPHANEVRQRLRELGARDFSGERPTPAE